MRTFFHRNWNIFTVIILSHVVVAIKFAICIWFHAFRWTTLIRQLRTLVRDHSSAQYHFGSRSGQCSAKMEQVTWVACSLQSATLPSTAVRGGQDSDGAPIYVGRAYHNGDMLVAKVMPTKKVAFVCYGGKEIRKTDVEVWVFRINCAELLDFVHSIATSSRHSGAQWHRILLGAFQQRRRSEECGARRKNKQRGCTLRGTDAI